MIGICKYIITILANPIKEKNFPISDQLESNLAIIATHIDAITDVIKDITGIPYSPYFIEKVRDSRKIKIVDNITETAQAEILLLEDKKLLMFSSRLLSRKPIHIYAVAIGTT